MKNFLKNLALIALVLVIASPVFAAKKSASKGGKATTIDLWYGAAVTEAGPPPADWVAFKIIKDKLGIDLKLTALPSNNADQNVKINAAGASNTLPDLFMVSDEIFDNLVKQGLVADVSAMFKLMPNRTAKLYDKDAKDDSTRNGKIYGLSQPGSIAKNEGVLIRKDWLDKLGLKVPVTTDDFFNVMKAFTEQDPDGNGKNDTYGFGAYLETTADNEGLGRRFDPLMGAFGVAGTWNMTKANAGLNVKKADYFDGLSFVKKCVDAGVVDPNWSSYKKDDFRAAWKQGKFGIMREQNAAYASESNYAPFDKNFPNGEWIIVNPPKGPKGLSAVGTYSISYRRYCVSAKAAKQKGKIEKIAELLEWMSSDEGYYLLGYGVEGVNFKKGANGVPTVEGLPDASKAYSKSENQPLTQLRNMVYYNSDAELTSRYPTYKTATSGKTMSALKALREMQSKPWTACIGVAKLPKPTADVERYLNQGVQEFLTGKRSLTKENWNAFLKEFGSIGGDAWESEGISVAKANNLLK
jgi:putative aldouronate transport system substrate-binding protein